MKRSFGSYIKNGILSTIILVTTIITCLILYVVIISRNEQIRSFNTIFYLCIVTFVLGVGIFISALIKEKMYQETDVEK